MQSATVALANVALHVCLFAEAIPHPENRSSLTLVQLEAAVLLPSKTLNAGHRAHKSPHHGQHGSPIGQNLTRRAEPSVPLTREREAWWQPVPYQHHFKFIDFVQRLRRKHLEGRDLIDDGRPLATSPSTSEAMMAEPVTERGDHSKGMMTVAQWQCCFVASIVLLVLFSRCISTKYVVTEPDLSEYEYERGRPCWNYACGALFIMLLMITFWMTLMQVGLVNDGIRKDPVATENSNGVNVTVISYVIQDPGERAFEAGVGIAFSILIACITICSWHYYSQVRITSALLAQFILRGGTLSVFVALALEIVGSILLSLIGLLLPLFEMTIVGFSEEGAKMVATVCGVWLIGSKMEESPPGCCGRCCWRVLVEHPRALMLAGLAVGYGFMIVENVEYLLQAATTPGTTREYPGDAADETTDGATTNFFTGVTIAIRVLLNIHPWLAGITAGRVASVAFKNAQAQEDGEKNRDTAMLSTCELLWAVWPSAVAHGTYDLILVVVPILGIFAPPLFWYFSRRCFYNAWDEAEKKPDALEEAGASNKIEGSPKI